MPRIEECVDVKKLDYDTMRFLQLNSDVTALFQIDCEPQHYSGSIETSELCS